MFKRLPDSDAAEIAVVIDGQPYAAHAGDTVACALLAAGRLACRATPVSGAPRGPYCMMGVCFDCLVVVDGCASQQGCLIPVAAGMRIETQPGARDVVADARTGEAERAGSANDAQESAR
jgi:predicted molibdopterin-dependent oxidoreductase YjgC